MLKIFDKIKNLIIDLNIETYNEIKVFYNKLKNYEKICKI